MEARDLAAIVDTFAPDAVFRSPLTNKLAFHGREQIAALTEVVLDVFKDLRYTDELRTGDLGFLVGRATVGSQPIEWVDQLRLDPDGKISELTVFFRPLPATAVALRLIGSGLARRRSPVRAALISALARPLGFMTRTGDGIGVRLVRPTL
jgi:SnoaL-like domain